MPVIYWDMSIKDANGQKMSLTDYKNMSKAERDQCEVRPFLRSFRVYNIDQTNMQEVNKEKYDKIISRFQPPSCQIPKACIVMRLSTECLNVRNGSAVFSTTKHPSKPSSSLPMT